MNDLEMKSVQLLTEQLGLHRPYVDPTDAKGIIKRAVEEIGGKLSEQVVSKPTELTEALRPKVTLRSQVADFLVAVAASRPLDANAKLVYQWATELNESNTEAWNGLGRALLKMRDFPSAEDAFDKALDSDSKPAIWVNLSAAVLMMGEYENAINCCKEALLLDPGFMPAYIQLAGIYEEIGDEAGVLQVIAAGLSVDPENHDLLFARAARRLHSGDWAEGWKDYEHRPSAIEWAEKMDEVRLWDGKPFDGTVVFCAEQGLGDQVMFSRYLLAVSPARLAVLYAKPDLARLFSIQPWLKGHRIITSDAEGSAFDVQRYCPIASLPHILGMPEPLRTPRMIAPSADVDRLRCFIRHPDAFNIGLCWKGNPGYRYDHLRSMAFEQLRPLLDVNGCEFYSLQYGDTESGLPNLAAKCHDIADLAAAIECLDLVITIDTLAAHVAGSMGKPTWLLSYIPGYWPFQGENAAKWYPSVRVFRQERAREWSPVIQEVLEALAKTPAPAEKGGAVYGQSHRSAPPYEPIASGPTRYGQMSWYKNDAYQGRSLALYGEYSQAEADLLKAVLKPGDVVIEAGANIGALTAAIEDDHEVYAVEPDTLYNDLLCRNAGRATIYRLALGSEDGKVVKLPGVEIFDVYAPSRESKCLPIHVEQRTIDSLFGHRPVALIKIDTDGTEHEILKGAEKTIDRFRPLLYVEFDKEPLYPDMIPWLIAKRYRVYSHLAPLYNPDNFAGNKVNVFGSIVSSMLFCTPMDRYDLDGIARQFGMTRVRTQKKAA